MYVSHFTMCPVQMSEGRVSNNYSYLEIQTWKASFWHDLPGQNMLNYELVLKAFVQNDTSYTSAVITLANASPMSHGHKESGSPILWCTQNAREKSMIIIMKADKE